RLSLCRLCRVSSCFFFFSFTDTSSSYIYTLSLHDALPIFHQGRAGGVPGDSILLYSSTPCSLWSSTRGTNFPFCRTPSSIMLPRSEEHTSELQSRGHIVCRLLLEKKNS